MKLENLTELQLQIIINNNLYKKNIIDEDTFTKANDKLLKMIRVLKSN